jgi:hypothetical protein
MEPREMLCCAQSVPDSPSPPPKDDFLELRERLRARNAQARAAWRRRVDGPNPSPSDPPHDAGD